MSTQPVLAIVFGGLGGAVSDNTTMLKHFLLRIRSFSLGYIILCIIYLIKGIIILHNNDNDKFGIIEILISLFYLLASISVFRVSLYSNVMTMTTIVIFR